jgi:hypothetical protein
MQGALSPAGSTIRWLACACLGLCPLACGRYWVCDEPADADLARLPARLSETGLFADVPSDALALGVRAYRPQFALWSDGADKRRWVSLPVGSRIDSADPDDWSFPVGTKFWKEFTRDGVRVETRLLTRWGTGQADWIGAAYIWNDDGSDAGLSAYGAENAGGTAHDVPAAGECMACHGGTKSVILGFSAIQLAHDADDGGVTLQTLNEENLWSEPISNQPRVPGDATERAALGYLHANCGHCHNQDRPARTGARCFDPDNDFDFRLSVHALGSVADTPTRKTIREAVKPGAPGASRLIDLMSQRGLFKQMPPLASERVDPDGVELISAFIREL